MQNYDTFKKIQSEFANNEQFGSAIKENEAYVNSLSGKINEFKEIWKDTASSLVTNDFLKDSMDGVNAFSEGIGTLVKSLGNLSGTIKPIMAGFATFGTMKLGSKLFDTVKDISAMSSLIEEGSKISDVLTLSNSKFTQNISKSFGVMKKSMAEGNGLLSSLGAGFTSLGKIGTAAFAGLAVGGVGMLISYLDNLKEKERQAYEERKENIASMQESTKQMQSQRDGLANIVAEYDKLSNKTKLSEKELERFNQLKQKIADTNPELTDGIDADGNPIIKLNGSLQEYITNLDKAIAKQQSLTYADLKENSKQAMKTLNKYDTVASDSNSETLLAHQLSYNRKIEDLRRKEQQSYQKYLTSQGKDREKALADLRAYQNEEQEVYAEYSKNFDIVKNDIEQAASQLSQRMVEGLKSNKVFTGLSEDLQSQFLEFSNSLDFSEITSEDMFASAQVSLQNLLKLAQSGKLDFKDLQKSISDATKEFNQTGDMDAYVKNVDEILNSVDGLNQLDKDVLRNMFVGVPESLHETSSALDTVLEKFGKTKLDVQNGDILANDLKKQFESVTALADLEVSSDAKVNLNIVTDIINNNELPTELRNLVNQMANDRVASDKIIEVVKQIALDYQLDGELDQEGLQKFIDTQVGEGKYTITPEMVVDPKIESKAKEKLEQELKGYDKISGRKEIKTLFTTDVVGLEKAQLFEETIEKLPVNKEFTNKFLCDFATDISELESYEEVLALIDSLPDDVKKKYGFEVETNAEEEKEKLNRIESMQFTDKQQRIIADTTDAEYKLQLFQSMTPEEMSMILNLNSIPAEEKLAFFNSLSLEQKVAILTCNPNPGIGVLDLWDSLSAEDKQSLIKADPSGALAQLSKYNNTPVEHKESKITANNSDAIKKSTVTKTNINSIPNVHNTSIDAKDNASSVIKAVDDKEIKNKSFTITGVFKTIGNAVSNFFGGKGGKSVSTNQGKTISYEYSTPTVAEQPNKIALLSDNGNSNLTETQTDSSYNSFNPLSRATIKTPIANKGYNIDDSIKYNIEMLTELENRIKMVTNSLSALDTKMEQAVGSEKIKYLQEQNKLYEEQKKIQKELEDTLNKQRNYYKYVLEYKGFKFNSDGNLTNYEEKLASMEKYVESLEKSAKSAQDALSKVDSNSKNKTSLEKKANEAQSKYEREKDKLDEAKKYLQAYIDVQMTELPKCKEEWDKLNNSIIENNNEIKKIQHEKWTLNIESQWTVLNQELDKTNNQLEMINVLMENAFGNDKSKLIAEKISLLKKQKSELASNLSYLKSVQSELNKKLTGYGFKFDSNGNISNYVDQLNKLKETSTEFDDAKKLVDAYLDLFLDKVPDVEKEIAGLENTIKDSYKEQLEITKDIESKITEVYKKQVEERKKLIDEELDKRLDALEKEKKAYNDARKEADYNKDYNKQMETIADLEKQIDILSRDNSLSGQKKLQELMKQLADEQEKLQEMVQDKMDEQVNDMFDKESDRLEQEADKAKENLDDKYSDEKLQQIVKDTLSSGVFVGVNGEIQDLQSTLIDFENKFGDGMSAMGDIIKNELVTNLNIAKNTIQDMSNIIKELDLKQLHSKLDMSVLSSRSIYPDFKISSAKTPPIINFNKELIRVEGNITEDVLPQVEEMLNAAKNEIVREIVNSMD